MVLVEKDVGKISLVRMFPQPNRMVEDIVEVKVEDELRQECGVEEEKIDPHDPHAERTSDFLPEGKESGGQSDQEEEGEVGIGVDVHAPPESVAKTVVPFAPFSRRRFFRSIAKNENQPKDGAEQGGQKR